MTHTVKRGHRRFYFSLRPWIVFALLLGALPLTHLRAQESLAPAPSKVERKDRAPVSHKILRVNIPKPVEAKLKNGLTVLILEDQRAPFINLQFYINGAGALFEPADLTGLASATAQMLREGTKSKNSLQIAEAVDRLGASISAGSSFGSPDLVLSASGLSDNFDDWFALTAEVLLNPSFPADELEKLKQRQRVQLREQRATANFLLNERFSRAVFGTHPAAVVSPTRESIDKLSREALMRWHSEHFVPQETILGVAGAVHAKEFIAKLEKRLGSWKRRDLKPVWPRKPAAATARKIFLVDRPNSVQASVALGNIAIDRRSADYFSMVVMNHVIGGGASSRLFLNLREEKGYTYGVYSDFSAGFYPGPWRAAGNMRTEVTEGALSEFFHEIRRIREDRVPAAELEATKRSIAASFALSLEQPTRVLSFAITSKIYGLPNDYWNNYPARILAINAEDVQRVARKYLNPDSLQIAVVGDASKIKPILEKYGAVEIYNADGARIAAGS